MCVITAYGVQCLVAGCQASGAGQQAMRPGRGMLYDIVASSWFFFSTHMQRFADKHTSIFRDVNSSYAKIPSFHAL